MNADSEPLSETLSPEQLRARIEAELAACEPTDLHIENPKDIAARDKCPLQLIPPVSERLIAGVLASGAAKYGPWNWRAKGIGLMTYIGAIQRHANAIRSGEDVDPESGLPHVAHIAATAAILMDAAEHEKLIDDRPGA